MVSIRSAWHGRHGAWLIDTPDSLQPDATIVTPQSVASRDLWQGGAQIEIMSWGTHGGLQGRLQQLLDD